MVLPAVDGFCDCGTFGILESFLQVKARAPRGGLGLIVVCQVVMCKGETTMQRN